LPDERRKELDLQVTIGRYMSATSLQSQARHGGTHLTTSIEKSLCTDCNGAWNRTTMHTMLYRCRSGWVNWC